ARPGFGSSLTGLTRLVAPRTVSDGKSGIVARATTTAPGATPDMAEYGIDPGSGERRLGSPGLGNNSGGNLGMTIGRTGTGRGRGPRFGLGGAGRAGSGTPGRLWHG